MGVITLKFPTHPQILISSLSELHSSTRSTASTTCCYKIKRVWNDKIATENVEEASDKIKFEEHLSPKFRIFLSNKAFLLTWPAVVWIS